MQSSTAEIKVKMKVERLEDGSFYATFPQIGCIFVHEETEEKASCCGREALEEYLKVSLNNGDPIPEEMSVLSKLSRPLRSKPKWGDTEVLLTGSYA